jgi:hypothetical protein
MFAAQFHRIYNPITRKIIFVWKTPPM